MEEQNKRLSDEDGGEQDAPSSHPEVPSNSHPLPRPIIAIDPSLKNLGFAVIDWSGLIRHAIILQQLTSHNVSYHARGLWMAREVHRLIDNVVLPNILQHMPQGLPLVQRDQLDVVMEVPTNWFNERGIASKDDEAVQKLYYQVGAIVGTLCAHPNVSGIWVVEPMQWKGQAPKNVMKERAFKYAARQGINLPDTVPHDTCEAILLARFGMAHYDEGGENNPRPDSYTTPLVNLCIRRGHLEQSQFSVEDFIDG